MNIVVIFYNIGGYHIARLRAAASLLQANNDQLIAIQEISHSDVHPWNVNKFGQTFKIITLHDPGDDTHNVKKIRTALNYQLNHLSPDVVIIPGWGTDLALAAQMWCCTRGVPTVVMSESKYDDMKRFWLKEKLKSLLYIRKYDAALVGGVAHKNYLIQLGIPSNKIFLGYDVVDNDYFISTTNKARNNIQAARERQPDIPAKPYFLAVSRFIPRKNIIGLIRAYNKYRSLLDDDNVWDLVLLGSGNDEEKICTEINIFNLEHHVHMPGFKTYEQIPDWYALASALIHPAIQEPWGLVINEASASGLPVLCSQTAGASELIKDGVNGFLFDPYDMNAMASCMQRMHKLSQENRLEMGLAGQNIIKDWGPERFAESLMSAIKVI